MGFIPASLDLCFDSKGYVLNDYQCQGLPITGLSGGLKMKIALARAMLLDVQ
jgi:hypothetical protein